MAAKDTGGCAPYFFGAGVASVVLLGLAVSRWAGGILSALADIAAAIDRLTAAAEGMP